MIFLVITLLLLILMTGYFSTDIEDLQGIYSVTTYWVTFTIVLFTCVSLKVATDFLQVVDYTKFLGSSWLTFLDPYGVYYKEAYKRRKASEKSGNIASRR